MTERQLEQLQVVLGLIRGQGGPYGERRVGC